MKGSRLATAGRVALGLMLMTALALVGGAAFAQAGGGRRGPDANRQLDRLTQHLQLDAAQQKQILPILQARDEQMIALRGKVQSGELDRAAARSQMRAIHQETTQKIEAVLTPDQRKAYEQHQAQMAKRWREHRGMHGGGGGMGPGSGGGMGPGSGGGMGMGPGGGAPTPEPSAP